MHDSACARGARDARSGRWARGLRARRTRRDKDPDDDRHRIARLVAPNVGLAGRAPAREPGFRVDDDDRVGPRVERERERREGARHLRVRDGALALPRAEIPDAELQVPDLKAAVASRDQQLAGGMCAGGEVEDVDDAVVARRRAAPSSNQSTVLRLSPGLSGRCS